MKPPAVRQKMPELVVQFESGEVWDELRVALPEGLRAGELEFVSPGLRSHGWTLSLLRTKSVLLSIGTMGAIWQAFHADDSVQLWLPGDLQVPEGVVVQVSFGEGES